MSKIAFVHIFAVHGDDWFAMLVHVTTLVNRGVLDRQSGGHSVIVLDRLAMQTRFVGRFG